MNYPSARTCKRSKNVYGEDMNNDFSILYSLWLKGKRPKGMKGTWVYPFTPIDNELHKKKEQGLIKK